MDPTNIKYENFEPYQTKLILEGMGKYLSDQGFRLLGEHYDLSLVFSSTWKGYYASPTGAISLENRDGRSLDMGVFEFQGQNLKEVERMFGKMADRVGKIKKAPESKRKFDKITTELSVLE